jgi:hypothetical protein
VTSAQRTRLHPGRGRARAGREMDAANGAMMGREQRQRRIMARMPDEVAVVVARRVEHRELKEKINYEAAMFKRQEIPTKFKMGDAGAKCVTSPLFVKEGNRLSPRCAKY